MESNLDAFKSFLAKDEFNQKELMQLAQVDSSF